MCSGIVKKDSVINGKNIVVGDVLIGPPSSGVHSNGFSLVQRVLAQSGLSLQDQLASGDVSIAEALRAPTVIYVKKVLDLVSKGGVKELMGSSSCVQMASRGRNIEGNKMLRTFNMGIGMVLVVNPDTLVKILENRDEQDKVYKIGEVVRGKGVSYS
ncbi:hypothetical protein K1719_040506 [Acacia pycnantha]|nr:hypothetical protein K1719_040506 [Acacia pycnantha]